MKLSESRIFLEFYYNFSFKKIDLSIPNWASQVVLVVKQNPPAV